jgi:hypothetical protein
VNRLKNLGKYAHKPKVDVGKSEDDMSAKSKVNSKIVPNKMPSKTPKGGGVRG